MNFLFLYFYQNFYKKKIIIIVNILKGRVI